jgi:hypothetical protein
VHYAQVAFQPTNAAKKLRKDELEKAIVAFLRTGNAALPTKRSLRRTRLKDVERGLNLKLRIENYTSNRETKDFIGEQAQMMAPDVREKSGVWYRLNRWREEQITSGEHPTYGDLVRQFVGRAIAALAADPKVQARTGMLFGSWELGRDYGLSDYDGRRPDWGRHKIDFSTLPPTWLDLFRTGR